MDFRVVNPIDELPIYFKTMKPKSPPPLKIGSPRKRESKKVFSILNSF